MSSQYGPGLSPRAGIREEGGSWMTVTKGAARDKGLGFLGYFAFSGGQWRFYYASGPITRGNPSKAPSPPAGD